MPSNTPQLQSEYQNLFDTCIIKPEKYVLVDIEVNRIVTNRSRYETVSKRTNVPWYFIAVIHGLEGSGNFTTHLHNGDPLTNRTVHVPKGRPLTGEPPFQWEDSACDALQLRKLDQIINWSIPEILFQMEGYNGFGYHLKGIYSPYLWSFSNHYTKGKYAADGIYDPDLVSEQTGGAVVLRRLAEKQIALSGEMDKISRIKSAGSVVMFDPNNYSIAAQELQKLLSDAGQPLKPDGLAGRNTSDAFFRVTGTYLNGDKNA